MKKILVRYYHSTSQDIQKYPIILTPARIIHALNKEISKDQVYELMNILPKKNQLLHPPSKPLDFHYVKRRELNDGCGIIWGIVLLIFPVSMLMYSLYRGGFGVSLLFLAFTIYFIYFFITEETSVTQVREKIPDDRAQTKLSHR